MCRGIPRHPLFFSLRKAVEEGHVQLPGIIAPSSVPDRQSFDNAASQSALMLPPYRWCFSPLACSPTKRGTSSTSSVILADAVRQIDYRQREMEFVAGCPREVIEDVLDKLYTITEE